MRFTSIIVRATARSISVARMGLYSPAMGTTRSRPPQAVSMACAADSSAAASVMSSGRASALPSP